MNTAVSFSASGLDFLVVNIEWNAQPDVLEWARGILDDPAYGNHHVIMAPHAYIDANGSLDNPRWGAQLADFVNGLTALLDEHSSNVFLTLNGHFATECGYNTPRPINNRNELMFDRQDCADAPGDQTGRGRRQPAPERHGQGRRGDGHGPHLRPRSINGSEPGRMTSTQAKWRTISTEQYAVSHVPEPGSEDRAIPQRQ